MSSAQRVDSQGVPFKYLSLELENWEYAKVVSEINSNYGLYDGLRLAMHRTCNNKRGYCAYYFENRGFNDYNIYKIEKY